MKMTLSFPVGSSLYLDFCPTHISGFAPKQRFTNSMMCLQWCPLLSHLLWW